MRSKAANAGTALAAALATGLAMTAVIWLSDAWLRRPALLPDSGPSWYVWQRPTRDAAVMAGVWVLYALHQIGFWALIWYGQKNAKGYSTRLHRFNLWALCFNAVFVLLHFAQTQLFYDALAKDVSIWSSQISVIILLVWVLLMENDRRGLVFGKVVPTPGGPGLRAWARKYHGYYFAWAAVYTFWYHPMETTTGHLIGFFYMFMILVQGSLFLTRAHVNRWWTVALEVAVLVHGTVVALHSPRQLWFQFAWGFATIFIVTQMHGLGLSRTAKWVVGAAYAVSLTVVVALLGPDRLLVLPRVPAAEYAGIFVVAGLLALGLWVARRFSSRRAEPSRPAEALRGAEPSRPAEALRGVETEVR